MRIRQDFTYPMGGVKDLLPKFRIRSKFIGILMIAAVLPLCIALAAAQLLGFRYYRKAQGTLFENRAQEIAQRLGVAIHRQIESLDTWVALSDLAGRLPQRRAIPVLLEAAERRLLNQAIEARWPQLSETDPILEPFLRSELAGQLRAFQAIHPLYAELTLAGPEGELIAATQKPAESTQTEREWLRQAVALGNDAALLRGIRYDPVTGLYSMEIALPIRAGFGAEAPVSGVLKGVINVSPLLASVQSPKSSVAAIHEIVLGDGQLLARMWGRHVWPSQERIPEATAARVARGGQGWLTAPLDGSERPDLVGYAPVSLQVPGSARKISGGTPMFVLVHDKADVVLAPAHQQLLMVGAIGALIVLGSALAGYYIATRKIIAPLEVIRTSAQAIAASAKLEEHCLVAPPHTQPALARLETIHTGDEIEMLAHDFAYMAGRVLTYHDQLEAELRLKTAAIESDLQIAREFQEALMPRTYPRVPSEGFSDALRLEFQHIYRPASSVGGDFFDVLKLGHHRAGIFIADVMGHGARSALVTAILRALLHNLAFEAASPSAFLEGLNRHFHDIVRESDETIFVSAFYLILDTELGTAHYASAGHPSPLVANRLGGPVEALAAGLRSNPALGLFPESHYAQWERAVHAGDLFLLFTDGVHEAFNATGEEFGMERIRAIIREQIESEGGNLSARVVEAVDEFILPHLAADDICLVSIEVHGAPVVEEANGRAYSGACSEALP